MGICWEVAWQWWPDVILPAGVTLELAQEWWGDPGLAPVSPIHDGEIEGEEEGQKRDAGQEAKLLLRDCGLEKNSTGKK